MPLRSLESITVVSTGSYNFDFYIWQGNEIKF